MKVELKLIAETEAELLQVQAITAGLIQAGNAVVEQTGAEINLEKRFAPEIAESVAQGEGVATPDTTGAAPADTGVAVDARGMPWDARIHASSKALLGSGNWKNKRGVDETERAGIEAQLLASAPVTVEAAPTAPEPEPVDIGAGDLPPAPPTEDGPPAAPPETAEDPTLRQIKEVIAGAISGTKTLRAGEIERLALVGTSPAELIGSLLSKYKIAGVDDLPNHVASHEQLLKSLQYGWV